MLACLLARSAHYYTLFLLLPPSPFPFGEPAMVKAEVGSVTHFVRQKVMRGEKHSALAPSPDGDLSAWCDTLVRDSPSEGNRDTGNDQRHEWNPPPFI